MIAYIWKGDKKGDKQVVKARLRKKRVLLIFCTVLYICLMIATILFDSKGSRVNVSFGGNTLPLSSFNGVLNACMAMLSIIMVCTDYKKGFRNSVILMSFSIISMLRPIIMVKKLTSIPGIANTLIMLIAIIILRKQLVQREKDIVTDFLTGLKNRRGLMRILAQKTKEKKPFYLLYVDLDDFKFVNDNYGHKCGDQLLRIISQRMLEICGKDAVVSRLGGDEFVLLLPELQDINGEARKVVDSIGSRMLISGKDQSVECYVTASVGIVHYPSDSTEADALLKYADIAMYQAKRSGKNKIYRFDVNMETEMLRHAELESIIKESLDKDYFYLVYQPQYDINSRRLRGFEALLRLKTGDGITVSPGEFIPVAEETDLILRIDEYVIRHALREFYELIRQGRKVKLSINVSAKNICRYGFAVMMKEILQETVFPPEYLEIEITEYCIVQSLENAMENIRELKELGVDIALDDFGTGFASLSYLSRLSIDLLKVDKSFVDDIEKDTQSAEFVNAVISIGHLQGCKVIAEGVENPVQVEMLKSHGCDYIQGYAWGRPMSFADAIALPDVHE